jgi:hypothetical protein
MSSSNEIKKRIKIMEEPKNVEKVVEENRLGDFVQAYDFSESKEKRFWGLLALFVVAWIIISDPWIKFTCIVMAGLFHSKNSFERI